MKQKRDAQETKEKIIQAARDIFAKKGYSGTSVDDIARVVGITKGGIYWHFDSKLDLFIQMLESGYSEFMNLLNEIIAQDSAPLAKLRQLFTTTLMAIEEDKNFRSSSEILFFKTEATDELSPVIDRIMEYNKTIYELLIVIIKEGVQNGDIRKDSSPESIAFMLVSAVSGAESITMLGYTNFSIADNAESLFNNLLSGFAS